MYIDVTNSISLSKYAVFLVAALLYFLYLKWNKYLICRNRVFTNLSSRFASRLVHQRLFTASGERFPG